VCQLMIIGLNHETIIYKTSVCAHGDVVVPSPATNRGMQCNGGGGLNNREVRASRRTRRGG
jgi:hypothetical protein